MPDIKRYAALGVFSLFSTLFGCAPDRAAQLNAEGLVGEYVFYSADAGAPHDPDRLTLRADDQYSLLYVSAGSPATRVEGTWQLVHDAATHVEFGGRSYPVEVKGKEVRLLVDTDIGHWYLKL